jgi:hypothetical protein
VSHDNSPTTGAETLSSLTVPPIAPTDTTLAAALAYAKAGWYVVPIRRGTKHPGSVIGDRWQHQSSRDPAQLAEWFTGTDHGLALHVGRSGALVFDVDEPMRVPDILAKALNTEPVPPYQTTRRNVAGKGHFLYAVPHDAHYGNSPGQLGKGWGEVRGRNGIIVVAPSVHERADSGGLYSWVTTGGVPMLPDELAQLLPQINDPAEVATDAEVDAFADTFTREDYPGLLMAVMHRWQHEIDTGGSRHDAMVSATCWAAREAAAGAYSARRAHSMLRERFIAAMRAGRGGSDRKLSERQSAAEFAGMWSWAVAQAITTDLDAVRAKIEAAPRASAGLGFDPPPGAGANATPGAEGGDEDNDEPGRIVDLGPYLDGTYVPLSPSVGAVRRDGVQLLYPSRWHTCTGLTTAGKTMFALWHCLAVMRSGGLAVMLHFEELDPGGTIDRLRTLGTTLGLDDDINGLIRRQFVWVSCERIWQPGELDDVLAELPQPPSLMVLDGINAASTKHGKNPSDPESVGFYRHRFVTPATALGAAVLSLGHPVKDRNRQGEAHGFGSTAWLDEVDGASFRLVASPRAPIGRGRAGSSALYSVKDRYGQVEAHGQTTEGQEPGWRYLGQFSIDSSHDPALVELAVPKPATDATEGMPPGDSAEIIEVAEQITRVLQARLDPLGFRDIKARVTGRDSRISQALAWLEDRGLIEVGPGPRGTKQHLWVGPDEGSE